MAAGTREALLRIAAGLMRTKGYAAFSYADLVDDVGIKKASIHHHFPTKEDLGVAVVEEYISNIRGELANIEAKTEVTIERLEAFFALFRASAEVEMLPLCGALAAEMSALPEGLRRLTHVFFDMQIDWLSSVLQRGIEQGEIPAGDGARKKAFAILSLLEGSCFINWATREEDLLSGSVVRLIASQD
ncbi:TetR family transcriptional regulator [Advenella sp. S44]|uniref:TetR/AcrR family transcriptional regulator n=1 Tax=Advenella sp. S44 TaxID=1982755 RepID=UPI000C2A2747|nr:TetR/AcrR family transcriptional regulator [Advenella sp. S44]PJX22228.1 TetR family transcriptional regulator [Advenella sp. S44]